MTALPTLVIAGAARSGTTALADALGRHPDIALPAVKEPHFLAHEGQQLSYSGPGDEMMNRETITHLDAYLELFAPHEDVRHRIDASVSTMAFPDRSIPAIRAHTEPGAKVVVILREPAERARSAYRFLLARGLETASSFSEALDLEDERRSAGFHHMWWYRGLSSYGPQLDAFADAFGASLRVVVAEEFQRDPARTLAELCVWLDVNPAVDLGPFHDVNRGGTPKSLTVARLLQAARSQPVVQAGLRTVTTRRVRERVAQSNLQTNESAPDAEMQRLRDLHALDVVAVEAHLGRPIPAWQIG